VIFACELKVQLKFITTLRETTASLHVFDAVRLTALIKVHWMIGQNSWIAWCLLCATTRISNHLIPFDCRPGFVPWNLIESVNELLVTKIRCSNIKGCTNELRLLTVRCKPLNINSWYRQLMEIRSLHLCYGGVQPFHQTGFYTRRSSTTSP